MSGSNPRTVRYPRWKAAMARLAESALWPLAALGSRRRGLDAVRRILIVEPFRLGDAALLRGMFAPLRDRFPGAEIHLLLHPCAADLYRGESAVAKVHSWAFPWANVPGRRAGWAATLRFVFRLRSWRFDLGIDPRGDVRSQAAMLFAGCAERAGHTNYLASNVKVRGRLLTLNAGDLPLGHRTEMHNMMLRLLGCRDADAPPSRPPRRPGKPLRVLISTGAGWDYRLWPDARWAEVVRWLGGQSGVETRLVGTDSERLRLNRIVDLAGGGVAAVVTDLRGLLEELRAADLVICLDSAVMHLASEWFGLPVLALFGPGVVPLYRPRSAGSVVIDAQFGYPCAPCTQQRCVRPRAPCMSAIRVEDVLGVLRDRFIEPDGGPVGLAIGGNVSTTRNRHSEGHGPPPS